MPTPTPEPAHRPQGQKLDGTDLQEVLDSAANAGDLGKQQFFTPRPIAAALATPLPFTRPVFVDLMMGDGALLAGAFADLPPLAAMGHLHATRRGLGVDLDRRCARQPADLATPVDTCAADLTEFYGLLAEMNWQYDCGGFNPPFSLQCHTDRLAALADSEIAAVRQCFRKGRAHTDSTLASLLIALDRQTPMGEGYFICNHSTAVKLLGDPDQPAQPDLPGGPLRAHVWLWLTLPPGVFENVRDFDTAVLYFARSHTVGEPLHLTAPSADPDAIRATLATAVRRRALLRRGYAVHGADQTSATTVPLFRAAKEEHLRRHREHGDRQWNLWLEAGVIRRHLTPFQSFSGKIAKDLIVALNDLHGKTPMSLVVQKPSRTALLKAVRSPLWRVDPALLAAVEQACAAYAAERAPFYPLNPNQCLGFLDEEDALVCRTALTWSDLHRDRHFLPGKSYPLESSTRKIERDVTRPNILGTEESVTLHGAELVIRVQDESEQWWEFATFNDTELQSNAWTTAPNEHARRMGCAANKGVLKAKLELLAEHFAVPAVPDVAMLHPEKYAANLAAIDAIVGRPDDAPQTPPGNRTVAAGSQAPAAMSGSSRVILLPAQPAKKGKVTPRKYQRDDIARAAIHDGLVFGWDKGLGKSLALFLWMQVKQARRVLIVAPEALHEQLIIEGRDKFGIHVEPLRSQADFYASAPLQQTLRDVRNRRDCAVTGYWITSYTALGFNGADEWQRIDEDDEVVVTPKTRHARQCDPLWRDESDEAGIGETREYQVSGSNQKPETRNAEPFRIRCVYQPSLSTLVADLFDGVACDEAVRIKSNESYTSLGVRQLRPQYRLVLTGTPIKNHLIDIFWLIHWACGGHTEPCARWPYGNQNSAKEEFGNTHMFMERNHTREEKAAAMGKRRKIERRIPQICNVHRLWKLLAPAVLYRRKCDIGEAIVPKTIIPIKVKPGTAQHAVYRFHVENPPDFNRQGSPMNPIARVVTQLTNLRQAALCPHSENLSTARIRLHRLREILAEVGRVGILPASAVILSAVEGPLTIRSDKLTSKAVLVARKGESLSHMGPAYAAEAQVALEICERMMSGSIPVDVDAILKAAPNLAFKLRPAVVIETNVQSSRSWTDHNPKQAAILKLIEELIGQGEQVVIMSPFTAFSESLHRRLIEAGVSACLLDGGTSPAKRGVIAGQFKRGQYAVLIGGQKSMGEGHSFECASHLIMPSLDWALDTNSQSEDRVHRLNSAKPVSIYVMVTEGTIDGRLTDLYAEKGDSASLALSAELNAVNEGEINLGQLLADAIANFDATADTIDELDIEKEWDGSLKAKLTAAEGRFRQWHPPIVADSTGYRPTPAVVRAACADAGVAPVLTLVKGIRNATFGALLGTADPAAIAEGRAEFEAFLTAGSYADWRHAWRDFDQQRDKARRRAAAPVAARCRSAAIMESL